MVILKMHDDVNQKLKLQLAKSRDLIDAKTLPYVLATGKSELLVRDLFASQIDRSLCFGPDSFVAREWRAHDLTIFDDDIPIIIIEGKAWIHADIVSGQKLTSTRDSIKNNMYIDIEKINQTRRDFPGIHGYLSTLLVSCDSTKRQFDAYSPIKYEYKHRASIRRIGSLDAVVEQGNERFHGFIQTEFGATDITQFDFVHGSYRGLEVRATIFLFKFSL